MHAQLYSRVILTLKLQVQTYLSTVIMIIDKNDNLYLNIEFQLIMMAVHPGLQCPKKVSVKLGEQAIISCNFITGDPRPNITWTKDLHVISHNLTLAIDNVSISDGGTYNATANNGRSVIVQVELDIHCKYISY